MPVYLKIDLKNREALVIQKLKNDLSALPSKITFGGNNSQSAWYWQEVEEINKFYEINASKISDEMKIELPKDREGKVVLKAEYK